MSAMLNSADLAAVGGVLLADIMPSTYAQPSSALKRSLMARTDILAYWPLDERTGTVFVDMVKGRTLPIANAGTGTLIGQQRLVSNDFGASARVLVSPAGGAFGEVDYSDEPLRLTGAAPFTFAKTVKPSVTRSGASTRYNIISMLNSAGAGYEARLNWNSGASLTNIDVVLQVDPTHFIRVNGGDVPNDVNSRVVVTYDGSKTAAGVKIYLNGALVTTAIASDTFGAGVMTPVSATKFAIGCDPSGNQRFNGNIDEVSVHSTAWSAASVAADYALTAPARVIQDPTPNSTNYVLLDGDWGGDPDGIIQLLANIRMHKTGACRIIGVMCSGFETYEAPMVRALLDRYGLTYVPVGVYTGTGGQENNSSPFAQAVYNAFGTVANDKRTNYPSAVSLYRRVLEITPANAVTLLITGTAVLPYRSVLWGLGDAYNQATTTDLLAMKLKRIVMQGGEFPSGAAYANWSNHVASAQYVLNNLPASIHQVYHGHAIGVNEPVGAAPGATQANSPLKLALDLYAAISPTEISGGKRLHNYDALAGLYAVYGTNGGAWFGHGMSHGRVICANDATCSVDTTATGYDHSYVTKVPATGALAGDVQGFIDALGN